MKLFNRKNKQKGFTLVELVLVMGIITLITIGIYLKYKSISMDNNVKLETQDLSAISNKITSAYQSSTSLASLNTTTAIANGMVPQELIASPNIISRFGGTITITPVAVGAVAGYEMKINNILPAACGLLGTSKFANDIDEVWVNGVSEKTTGTALTTANISAITSACSTATNIAFRKAMIYAVPYNGSYTQTRPVQTSQYYIPTIASAVTSASTSCTGGASWTGSFCSCPATTEWNGSSCVSNTAILTNCGYGTGGNPNFATCQALPTTKTVETYYNGGVLTTDNVSFYSAVAPASRATCTLAGGYWDATTNICGGIVPTQVAANKNSLTPDVEGGRYVPQVMNGAVSALTPVTTIQGSATQCSASGGSWDGEMCNFCPAPTTIGSVTTAIVNATTGAQIVPISLNPTTNPHVLSGHAATSTWNVDRCVTPAAAAAPPYPQTVTW